MIFKKKKIQSQQFTESDIEKTFQELDRLNEKFLKNILTSVNICLTGAVFGSTMLIEVKNVSGG